jgi:hypothetical protein
MFVTHSFRDNYILLGAPSGSGLTFSNIVLCNRCDVLPDSEPPFCQHCKQYGFECTFFLPIAETRFKKKKLEEEAAANASAEKVSLERRHSSTPHGEGSSRSADARICGTLRTSSVSQRLFLMITLLQARHRKRTCCILALPFRHGCMNLTTCGTIILGK